MTKREDNTFIVELSHRDVMMAVFALTYVAKMMSPTSDTTAEKIAVFRYFELSSKLDNLLSLEDSAKPLEQRNTPAGANRQSRIG